MSRFLSLFVLTIKMPSGIRKNITSYFLKKSIGLQPTNHQTIWTSFLYFAAESNVQVSIENGLYKIDFFDGDKEIIALVRGGHSSDIFAFFQVFIARGYQPLRDFLSSKSIESKVVVDAGANVGYFSLLMAHSMDVVIAIEPENTNYQQLERNILLNGLRDVCHIIHKALWTHQQELSIQTNSLEWAVRVGEEKTDQTCLAISLPDLMNELSLTCIDVLKMDIEGTEGILFENELFLQSLKKVKVVAMEIHDHLVNRKKIHDNLRAMGFDFFEKGELTLAWNRELVNG
jgi:FkbM family methyltransferase